MKTFEELVSTYERWVTKNQPKEKLCIFMTGIPGAGKTTHAQWLAKEFNLFYFSTGDVARDLSDENHDIQTALDRGELCPIEELLKFMVSYLVYGSVVIDGYPRSLDQFKYLNKICKPNIIILGISRPEAIKRLAIRGREGPDLTMNRVLNERLDFIERPEVSIINSEEDIMKVRENIKSCIKRF